jgi:AraC-like DNA-binding protein
MLPRIELPPLADFVAATVIRSTPPERVNHLPDARTRLMFRLLPDGRADLHVSGPRRRAMYKRTTPCAAFIMIVFQPGGGYPFFGVPLAELVDRTTPLRDLWGAHADEVLDHLAAAATNSARLTVLQQALVCRMHGAHAFEPFAAPVVREAVARLSTRRTTLTEIASDLHLSGRSLRRAFSAVVGLSPKQYARIVRFQRTVTGAALGASSWSELATASGYFDQAHLCADFRDLARLSPTAFQRHDLTDNLRYACA